MARKDDSKVTKRVASRMERTRLGDFDFPSRPKSILWYLTHKFLFRGLNIVRLETWDSLLKRHVSDPKSGIPQTPEHRTSARGNMTSQIFSEDEGMSINNFIKAAVVAGVEEIEFWAVWKMPKNKRIVGKVRYPLTPDVLLNLSEEDEETKLLAEVTNFLQKNEALDGAQMKKLWRDLVRYKQKKIEPGESND